MSNRSTIRIGDICHIYTMDNDKYILSEVVGFSENNVLLMPLVIWKEWDWAAGFYTQRPLQVPVGRGLIGRVIDALGNPLTIWRHRSRSILPG